jgi:hypothetical protein
MMNDKPEDFAPEIDEIEKLFFEDDDKKEIDFSSGRPKKSKPKNKGDRPRKDPAKVEEENQIKAWSKEAKFLKKFEEKIKKRTKIEAEFESEKKLRKEQKEKIREKKLLKSRRNKWKIPSHLQNQNHGALYCKHNFRLERIVDGKVYASCTKCSVSDFLSQTEWQKHVNDKTRSKNGNSRFKKD